MGKNGRILTLTNQFSWLIRALINEKFECFTQRIHIFVIVIETIANDVIQFIFEIE